MVKKSAAGSKAKKTTKSKKSSPKKSAKKSTAADKGGSDEKPAPAPAEKDVVAAAMTIRMSTPLRDKIQSQAEEEGVSAEELVKEMISESVVLRAFEIAERRGQMRGGNHNQQQQQGNGNHNNNRQGGRGRFNNNRRGNMSQQRYQSIMDDKASFLEYVRNQERQGR